MNGPYDTLYASVPENILWGLKPSHLMQKLVENRSEGTALDLGCGDGVNALFLEMAGFAVTGIDISWLALEGLRNRFRQSNFLPHGTYSQANLEKGLARNIKYDVVVSCGLYQCLDKVIRKNVHRAFHNALTDDGVIVFSCLTNAISLPENHLTDGVELVDMSEVIELFDGMSVDYFKEGVIQDSHGTLVGGHQHSVVWVMARNAT